MLGSAALSDVCAPEGTSPVLFVRLTDFLPRERCADLLARVAAERARFVPAKVGVGKVDPDMRHALVSAPQIRWEVRAWFILRLRGAVEAVLARLPVCDLHMQVMKILISAGWRGQPSATGSAGR